MVFAYIARSLLVALLILQTVPLVQAFVTASGNVFVGHQHLQQQPTQTTGRESSQLFATTNTKATLTDETVWKIRFVMKDIETEKGKKVDEIFRIDAHFLEEEGYEPPQGSLQQLVNEKDGDRLKITKSYWQLSEDPNDRKDGFWVWGLFKEPLYPFLLLKLETDAIPLSSSSDSHSDEEKDFIKPLQLFAQMNHRRDSERGVLLEAADLKVRQMETMKADVFGAAKVDVYEEVSVGTISVQPAVSVENQ